MLNFLKLFDANLIVNSHFKLKSLLCGFFYLKGPAIFLSCGEEPSKGIFFSSRSRRVMSVSPKFTHSILGKGGNRGSIRNLLSVQAGDKICI